MGEILWNPEPHQIEDTALWRFMRSFPEPFDTYDDLWNWSVTDLAGFWSAVWDFAGVIASRDADARHRRPSHAGDRVVPWCQTQLRREPASAQR